MDTEEFFIDEFTSPVILPDNTVTTGIFDNQPATAFDTNTSAPRVELRAADAARCREGDSIYISGTEYIIKNREPTGDGPIILHLSTIAPL